MNTKTQHVGESFEFALPDAGSGGEILTATDLASRHGYVVAALLRDHYCPLSRQFVQSLADAYEGFAGRSTAVVPVLPDGPERAAVWQRRYDLPFGLLTDPVTGDGEAADEAVTNDESSFEQFDPFARLIPRLPGAVVFEADDETLRFVGTVDVERTEEGIDVDPLFETVDDHATDAVVDATGLGPGTETASDGFGGH